MMIKRHREDMDSEETVDRREEMREGVTNAADGWTGAATTWSRNSEMRGDERRVTQR